MVREDDPSSENITMCIVRSLDRELHDAEKQQQITQSVTSACKLSDLVWE